MTMGKKLALPVLIPAFIATLILLISGCHWISRTQPSKGSVSPEAPILGLAKDHRWTFAVLGDTRDATRDTLTGISPILHRISEAVAADKPDLVIHNGDLINGFYTDDESPVHGKFQKMFDNWKSAMQPIFDFNNRMGIPLYVVRGNHEDGFLLTDKELKVAYKEGIAPYMPQNGPEKGKGLTYSFTHNQATFIALDEYSIKEWGGLRGLVDQPWLNDQLSQNRGLFTFVFGHMPAFKVSTFRAGPFPDLYDFPKHRDIFWASLKQANVSIYFCGHVHFYCRVSKNGVSQVVVGNGGANPVAFDPRKVDPAVTLDYPRDPVKASEIKEGYLLVTVDEKARTISAAQKLWNKETGLWEIGDTFSIDQSVNQ
jgi:predicted phosphodiesterase